MKSDEFKAWLKENTTYSPKVISDISSRVNRANKILPWVDEPVYQFMLEQKEDYQALSCTIRSQIKGAVKLYSQFIHSSAE